MCRGNRSGARDISRKDRMEYRRDKPLPASLSGTHCRTHTPEALQASEHLRRGCHANDRHYEPVRGRTTPLYALVDDDALAELVAPLDDTMTYGIDFIEALDCSELWVEKALEH